MLPFGGPGLKSRKVGVKSQVFSERYRITVKVGRCRSGKQSKRFSDMKEEFLKD